MKNTFSRMSSRTRCRIFSVVALLVLLPVFAGCAHQAEPAYTTPKRVFAPDGKTADGEQQLDARGILAVHDPLEPFNRAMYNFNARFDRAVFLPVVSGYQAVMPDIAETGVTHFFNNLSELRNLTNNLLQGELVDSGVTLSRFAINTTVGLLGVWDPATRWGWYEREEDFGQTLGRWGVAHGPYIVLPFFGPSSLRDAGGLALDASVASSVDILGVNDQPDAQLAARLLQGIDTRKNTRFRYYETGTPFEYSLVRFAYLRMRDVQVGK